ncbi:MAG: hypothetical protein M3396_08580 [Actinomycetota bacterium]|nr:hypothetical protein [Actinomycetota bacterium]MDQ3575738.1 hypothetical protein [Actinomycetota bacterium]
MHHTPRLLGELDAVFRAEHLLEAGEVVAKLAARHPDAGIAAVMGALFGVLIAEVGVRLEESDAHQRREASVTRLLATLEQLPEGHGPRLLDWKTDHLVTRLLRAAWRDHSHLAWRAYQETPPPRA